jgi:uncharacterized protein YutE (UPF0331/DUF86 family)
LTMLTRRPTLAGPRNVLIHQYEGVDLERVWVIVEQDLPGLKNAVSALLPPLEHLERELAGEDEPPEQDN